MPASYFMLFVELLLTGVAMISAITDLKPNTPKLQTL